MVTFVNDFDFFWMETKRIFLLSCATKDPGKQHIAFAFVTEEWFWVYAKIQIISSPFLPIFLIFLCIFYFLLNNVIFITPAAAVAVTRLSTIYREKGKKRKQKISRNWRQNYQINGLRSAVKEWKCYFHETLYGVTMVARLTKTPKW